MKIAIVCSKLGYGGAERVAVMWANGLVFRGHDVVLISNLFEERTYFVNDRVNLYNLVSTNKNKIITWLSAILNIKKVVNRANPDVVIGIMGTCSIVSRLALLGSGISVIATEHNAFERPAYAPLSVKDRIVKFFIYRFFRCVTVLSKADELYVKNKLNNVFVLPNPLSIPPVCLLPSSHNNIIAVGRLDDWHCKGFDLLILAWGKTVESIKSRVENEGWKLQIAGSGSEKSLNYLKQLCKENGVEDSVEFLGFRNDVEKLYQDASIFVLSSRYEGFGLVLIEAMSQGCACVACDYKGRQREIMNPTPTLPEGEGEGPLENQSLETRNLNLDALPQRTLLERSGEKTRNLKPETRNLPVEACETGILCEPDDVESLAAGLRKMMEDDKYRESVRAKAIERSKYYSIENTIDRWEKLLDKVVN